MKKTTIFLAVLVFGLQFVLAQSNYNTNKFKQLYDLLPTPNAYRNAAGAPGFAYYQQKADYSMKIRLDDENQRIYGEETITYFNNSPDQLEYLWLQLDQNKRALESDSYKISQSEIENGKITFNDFKNVMPDFDGGFNIDWVKDAEGNPLSFTINKTMMRLNIDNVIKSGDSITFSIKWWYNINNRKEIGGRSGLEYFPEEDNYIYTIAQFFPRMAVYNDIDGWQNKQFLGRGEFTLPFGDYEVEITAPSNHIVGASGELQNIDEVLTESEIKRFEKAKSADKPVMIVNPKEALANEKSKSKGEKTWVFRAENVRDFAFASSKKFIWDAMGVKFGNRTVLAMSYYPKEGNPLWEKYSTEVVAHTLRVYSKYTFDYPYPVAISVHTDRIGMEYPMICFNGGRPESDGTYSERTKYGMIGVIIHEVGHNFFPMIVNSDERQWTWMDEGLNTFVQFLTEQEWDHDYPSRRGPAHKIVDYMKGDKNKISPIMTNSESIFQFGNNAYGKPATALNILRETIMGRELFDHAFKTYSNRWKFKHPSPQDFFRTMEDASGVDLDWFWRGWFYTNDHVDLAISDVNWYHMSNGEPEAKNLKKKDSTNKVFTSAIHYIRNQEDVESTVVEDKPNMKDFYNSYDKFETTKKEREAYKKFKEKLTKKELSMMDKDMEFYEVKIQLVGGLVMPVILKFTFEDNTSEKKFIPAEIWKMNDDTVSKLFAFDKKVKEIELDPNLETADVDRENNYWPGTSRPSEFELFKKERRKRPNPMRDRN